MSTGYRWADRRMAGADAQAPMADAWANYEGNGHSPPAGPGPTITGVRDPDRYAASLMDTWAAELAATPEGHRDDTLNRLSFMAGQWVGAGHLSAEDVIEQMTAAGRASGLPPVQIRKVARSVREGERCPVQVQAVPADVIEVDAAEIIDSVTGEVLTGDAALEAFWTARPELARIRTFAYARMCSPWAVLGVVLVRVLASVPPWITLPPIVGGRGSLNSFLCLVGDSGAGKGAAVTAAGDAVILAAGEPFRANLGSGEGIVHQYVRRATPKEIEDGGEMVDGDQVWVRDRIIFNASEVDLVAALSRRQGSTLLGTIREAFSGGPLGFAYSAQEKRTSLPPHSYRLCLILQAQPLTAGPLVDEGKGGTTQRLIWLDSTDRGITWPPPEEPEPWRVENLFSGHRQVITVPDQVRDEIGRHRASRARGERASDDLDGQAQYVREKLAAGFAVLAGRGHIDVTDWELAGVVMAVSDRTRAQVRAALRTEEQTTIRRRHKITAEGARMSEEAVHDGRVGRVAPRVLRVLRESGGEMAVRQLVKDRFRHDRDLAGEALDLLVRTGQVRVDVEANGLRIARVVSP